MPIKPRPFTFECEGCGWTKTVAPRSDALAPGRGSTIARSVGARSCWRGSGSRAWAGKSINKEHAAMKNIFAVVGFIVIVTKGYELYREYSEMKREKAAREAGGGSG